MVCLFFLLLFLCLPLLLLLDILYHAEKLEIVLPKFSVVVLDGVAQEFWSTVRTTGGESDTGTTRLQVVLSASKDKRRPIFSVVRACNSPTDENSMRDEEVE